MHEDGAPDTDAGPQVVVAITPWHYRRRALAATVAGLAVIVVFLLPISVDGPVGNPFLGLGLVGYGLYCHRQGRQEVTRTVLRIDRSGIRSVDGLYDQTWAGVVMVWGSGRRADSASGSPASR